MKILIPGGFGFIGSHVVGSLNDLGHNAIPVSRRNDVDFFNYESVQSCLINIKPDLIINCAANVGSINYVSSKQADVIHTNVQIALNMYKAISEINGEIKIINPLSNCSYPGDSDVQREEDWLINEVHDSVYSYGNSRRMIYMISKCYNQQYGINTSNFLIPNTFGPGDYMDTNKTHALNGMIIRMLMAQASNENEFTIWGTGNPVREWAYVDDVVNILTKGISIKKSFIYPLNLAQNKGYAIKESAAIIKEILGYKGKLVFDTNKQDGDPVKILDDKNFRKEFPNFTFFDHKTGIKNTVDYYKDLLKGMINE